MKKYNTVLEYLVALEQLYKEMASANGHTHENKEVIDQLTSELLEKLKSINLSSYALKSYVDERDSLVLENSDNKVNGLRTYVQSEISKVENEIDNIVYDINDIENTISSLDSKSDSFQIIEAYNNMLSLMDKKHYLCTNFSASPNIHIANSEGDFQEVHLTIMTDSIIQGIYTTFQCKWYGLPQWLEPDKVYHLTFRRFLDTWTCDVVTYV